MHCTSDFFPGSQCNPITSLPDRVIIFFKQQTGFCLVRVCVCVCVFVHLCVYMSPLGQKNYRNWELLALD